MQPVSQNLLLYSSCLVIFRTSQLRYPKYFTCAPSEPKKELISTYCALVGSLFSNNIAFLANWNNHRLHVTLQCVRRLLEERDYCHGCNAVRYFSTIIAVVIRTAFELRKGLTWKILAIASSAIATIMNTYWDIVVDWGLLHKKSNNFLLRDKLVLSHKSVYFSAMVM